MSKNNTADESAKFRNLKNLLLQLNEIHGTLFKNKFFEFKEDGKNLLIYGNPYDLAILLALLWNNTSNYIFYMENKNGIAYIRTFDLNNL